VKARLAALALLLCAPSAAPAAEQIALFAGGCFWCMEPPFEALPGVVSVTSGYTGGTKKDPSYEEVSAGGTGHAEAVQIVFDPERVSYEKLLDVYWHNIDPTVADRQFCDVGSQYRSAIFVRDAEQRRAAEASRDAVQKRLGVPVKTEIVDASAFYPAEGYHQDYSKKNPIRYRYYRWGCGRDARLSELWGADAPAH
jgi:peptide-methionine (S)-S-oxide reductase